MSFQTPSVLEIDHKLREDFRRRLRDYGIGIDVLDPVLAVIFRTFAQQIEGVYSNTGSIREALLDELISGIKLPSRLALPAQTVVRFLSQSAYAKLLPAGTELNAKASTGERISFGTDISIQISSARLAMALVYQDQRLQLLPSIDFTEALAAYKPTYDPVRVNLGQQPAIFLAIENLSSVHLSRHGLFFDLSAGAYAVQKGLSSEPWWLFGRDGDLSGEGLMRPRHSNRGVRKLEWQIREHSVVEQDAAFPALPDGFYAGRQFIFPEIKEGQELLCQVPRLLEAPLNRMAGQDMRGFLETPRAWIKIPLPEQVPALHTAIHGIFLHAVTASNVFCRNQTLHFAEDGFSVPIGGSSQNARQILVAPLSVSGLDNEIYHPGQRNTGDPTEGWYEIATERITLHPGHKPDGTQQDGVNIRLWLTNGELGNRVAPGDLLGFASSATFDEMRVSHLAAAAGGMDGEEYVDARRRFAQALMTRGRIVTRQDVETATLSFDRRILRVEIKSEIERGAIGLHRVERLWVTLDSEGFTKPDLELPSLQQELKDFLLNRMIEGTSLDIRFEWSKGGTA